MGESLLYREHVQVGFQIGKTKGLVTGVPAKGTAFKSKRPSTFFAESLLLFLI